MGFTCLSYNIKFHNNLFSYLILIVHSIDNKELSFNNFNIYPKTWASDLTATLNFDTDSVSITVYHASGKTDTLAMQQKINTE